jgi:RHS repeat-associated protein
MGTDFNWNRTFTGQVLDNETGLMLYRNRYYHVGLGRLINRDPIKYRGDGLNLYTYVKNKPSLLQDMFGKKLCQFVTPNQNGCGPKAGPKVPGDYLFFNFTPACNAHDLCWGTCGADKALCDTEFLRAMRAQCNIYFGRSLLHFQIYIPCTDVAYIYYWAVARSHVKFNDTQEEHCLTIPDDKCCPTPRTSVPPPLPQLPRLPPLPLLPPLPSFPPLPFDGDGNIYPILYSLYTPQTLNSSFLV